MKKFLLFAIILFAAYTWQKRATAPSSVVSKHTSHNQVIMYSLTTCGHCKVMASELQNANIAFTEKFIDTDANAKAELQQKPADAGLPPRSYSTPILDVHGTMMPDNPGLAAVRKRL